MSNDAMRELLERTRFYIECCESGRVFVPREYLNKVNAALAAPAQSEAKPVTFAHYKAFDEAGKQAHAEMSAFHKYASSSAVPAGDGGIAERGVIMALFQPWPKDELGPSDEPESRYRLGYNTALEDAADALAARHAPTGVDAENYDADTETGKVK